MTVRIEDLRGPATLAKKPFLHLQASSCIVPTFRACNFFVRKSSDFYSACQTLRCGPLLPTLTLPVLIRSFAKLPMTFHVDVKWRPCNFSLRWFTDDLIVPACTWYLRVTHRVEQRTAFLRSTVPCIYHHKRSWGNIPAPHHCAYSCRAVWQRKWYGRYKSGCKVSARRRVWMNVAEYITCASMHKWWRKPGREVKNVC